MSRHARDFLSAPLLGRTGPSPPSGCAARGAVALSKGGAPMRLSVLFLRSHWLSLRTTGPCTTRRGAGWRAYITENHYEIVDLRPAPVFEMQTRFVLNVSAITPFLSKLLPMLVAFHQKRWHGAEPPSIGAWTCAVDSVLHVRSRFLPSDQSVYAPSFCISLRRAGPVPRARLLASPAPRQVDQARILRGYRSVQSLPPRWLPDTASRPPLARIPNAFATMAIQAAAPKPTSPGLSASGRLLLIPTLTKPHAAAYLHDGAWKKLATISGIFVNDVGRCRLSASTLPLFSP